MKNPIKAGTRVVKCNSEKGDGHKDGSLGTIKRYLGPLEHPVFPDEKYFYFIEWDDMPGVEVGVRQSRIKEELSDGS